MKNTILENDIPYDKLAKLGISKETALSMPKRLLEPFLNGEVTPLIRARVRSRNGDLYEVPMKLQMIKDRTGKVLLMTYPVHNRLSNEMHLSQSEQDKLQDGNIIRKEINDNGTRRMQFIQMDRETKSLIRGNAKDLRIPEQIANLEKVKDIQLGQNLKDAIKEGKPVELNVGDQKVTVGLDNREPSGFKVVNGDMEEWKKQEMIKFDLVNEGFMGYVMTDKNRWEYQQVINKLEHKDIKMEQKETEKNEVSRGSGMKLG